MIPKRLRGTSSLPTRWLRLKNLILLGLSMSSLRPSQRSKSKGRTTRWLLMREISSEHNLSKETKSLLCSMRRSRFKNLLWRRERFTIKRKSMISWTLGKKFPSWRENSLLLNARLHVSQILRGKSTSFKKSTLSNSKRLNICSTSLQSHSTFIGGESLNALTQKLMKWSKRSSLSRKGLLPRLKRYLRRMCSFKRKKSFTSSSKISWPSSLVLK